jgi:hypothetical protein
MTNEMIGIASLFGFTGILLLLHHLILTAGKPKSTASLAKEPGAAKRGPRPVDSRDEKEGARSQANRAMRPDQPGSFARFRI